MKSVASAKARDAFSKVVNRAALKKERVVLTRREKGIVAVVPIEDLRLLGKIDDYLDAEDAERILSDPGTKWLPYDKVRAGLGLSG